MVSDIGLPLSERSEKKDKVDWPGVGRIPAIIDQKGMKSSAISRNVLEKL
jgi:hypothetical protein